MRERGIERESRGRDCIGTRGYFVVLYIHEFLYDLHPSSELFLRQTRHECANHPASSAPLYHVYSSKVQVKIQ